jgi:hypothetical protein
VACSGGRHSLRTAAPPTKRCCPSGVVTGSELGMAGLEAAWRSYAAVELREGVWDEGDGGPVVHSLLSLRGALSGHRWHPRWRHWRIHSRVVD